MRVERALISNKKESAVLGQLAVCLGTLKVSQALRGTYMG